jgi:hypothetical protein
MLESMQSLRDRVDVLSRRGRRTGAAPWGTVTSLPSTINVISPLRAEVEENERRPMRANETHDQSRCKIETQLNVRLFRQSEQAKRDNQPFDVGRDAAETSLSIL